MKVAAIVGPRQSAVETLEKPQVREGYCLIKVTVVPMCTEHKAFSEGMESRCLGHEAVGVVEEVGPAVTRVEVGQRVVVMPTDPCGVCDHCGRGDYIYCEDRVDPLEVCQSPTGTATYAQYVIKADWLLIPIPDDMSDAHAAMACCGLGPGFGAMQNMGVDAFDSVLVTGLGPVGLGTVINAVYRNASVIGVEGNPYRAALAMQLGAKAVIDPADPEAMDKVRDATDGKGPSKAVDCTALPVAQQFAYDALRRRGHMCCVGWGGNVQTGNMIPDGKTLQGSWHWNLCDTPRMMQLIRETGDSIDQLITHRLPMSDIQQAWELQLTGQCGKVLLDPWA